MKAFFWGQFDCKEFAMSFCMAWRRQMGELYHYPYRAIERESNEGNAITTGLQEIAKQKPAFVIMWQGPTITEETSKKIRTACDEIEAKFVFISLDDPFFLYHSKFKPYAHAHIVVTCCLEAKKMYNERGVNNVIFAPPACSIDVHMAKTRPVKLKEFIEGVFCFFTNPYIGEPYEKYGAINRLETIRQMLRAKIKVSLASVEHLRGNSYLLKEEWEQIDWKGFVPYEEFPQFANWAFHLNSSVIGPKLYYFNQRVFEILGIGSIQFIDVLPESRGIYEMMLREAGLPEAESPFIFYLSPNELAEKAKRLLSNREEIIRRRGGAERIRWLWTFDHLVRKIAYSGEEETIFDRFEKLLAIAGGNSGKI